MCAIKKQTTGDQFATLRRLFLGIPVSILETMSFLSAWGLMALLAVELAGRVLQLKSIYAAGFAIFGGLAELTTILWIGKKIFSPGSLWNRKWLVCDLALALMLLWCCISTLLSPDPAAGFSGSLYRQEGMVTYFIYGALYLCLRQLQQKKQHLRLVQTLCVVLSVMSTWSLLCHLPAFQKAGEVLLNLSKEEIRYFAFDGIFRNHNHYAYLLCVSTVLSGGLYAAAGNRWHCWIWVAMYTVQAAALVFNGTLGGWLAVVIGLIALIVVSQIRPDFNHRGAVMLVIIFLLISLCSRLTQLDITRELNNAITDVKNAKTTFSNNTARLYMWGEALEYISQRPLLGYGPDGSGVVFFHDVLGFNDRPHNEYLQYAVYFGIPGIVMYLTAMSGLLVRLLKHFRKLPSLGVVIACSVLTYCASAFVGNSMYNTTVYFVCLLALLVNTTTENA